MKTQEAILDLTAFKNLLVGHLTNGRQDRLRR